MMYGKDKVEDKKMQCPYCQGKGHTYSGKMPSGLNDQYTIEEAYKCSHCDGSGYVRDGD